MDDFRANCSAIMRSRIGGHHSPQCAVALERCSLAFIGDLGSRFIYHHVWVGDCRAVTRHLYRCGAGNLGHRDFADHAPVSISSALYHSRHYADGSKGLTMSRNSIIRIAHRGASSQFPENTLLAFRQAIEQGVDMLELDVHSTADAHLVVIHDRTLERTTNGHGYVNEHRLEEIRQLDAGRGETIPLFEEVIELAREAHIRVCVEIK